MSENERPEEKKKKKPGIVGKAGRGLGKLLLTFVFGLILLTAAFLVLVWGEKRVNIGTAIEQSTHLNDEEASDGEAVTYEGALRVARPASDALLVGGPTEGAAQYAYVIREVQTCAWVEEKEKQSGGGSKTTYEKRWVAQVPDSDDFATTGHRNVGGKLEKKETAGAGIRVGEYDVPEVTAYYGMETLPFDRESVSRFVKGATDSDSTWVYFALARRCTLEGGASIGDQRVAFKALRAGDRACVFGTRDGQSIAPFRGQTLLARGDRQALISSLKEERASTTWWFRGGGALLLWIALYLVISPILKFVTWIPILGGLIKGAATVITLVVAAGLTIGFVFFGWGMAFFMSVFGGIVG